MKSKCTELVESNLDFAESESESQGIIIKKQKKENTKDGFKVPVF